jgi:hypothetical protein
VPYNTSHTTNTHKPQNQTQKRCSHPLCNTQHTTTPQPPQPPPHPHTDRHRSAHHTGCVRRPGPGTASPRKPHQQQASSQDPTACRTRSQNLWCHVPPSHTPHNMHKKRGCGINKKENPRPHAASLPPPTGKLLRKEVIQPHLPVRLPCYDFVPIAGPTFDHSPPTRGLGHGLRVLPTFVT